MRRICLSVSRQVTISGNVTTKALDEDLAPWRVTGYILIVAKITSNKCRTDKPCNVRVHVTGRAPSCNHCYRAKAVK